MQVDDPSFTPDRIPRAREWQSSTYFHQYLHAAYGNTISDCVELDSLNWLILLVTSCLAGFFGLHHNSGKMAFAVLVMMGFGVLLTLAHLHLAAIKDSLTMSYYLEQAFNPAGRAPNLPDSCRLPPYLLEKSDFHSSRVTRMEKLFLGSQDGRKLYNMFFKQIFVSLSLYIGIYAEWCNALDRVYGSIVLLVVAALPALFIYASMVHDSAGGMGGAGRAGRRGDTAAHAARNAAADRLRTLRKTPGAKHDHICHCVSH